MSTLGSLRREILKEHFPDLEHPANLPLASQTPVVKACANCLYFDKGKECVWYDREIDERSWVALCGFTHWEEKPPHMYMKPEDRVFPFQLEEKQSMS
jgi:hypothetical protein